MSPLKLGRCWIPSRLTFGKRTRASVNRASPHRRKGRFIQSILTHTSSLSSRTPLLLRLFVHCTIVHLSPRGNPPPPHWSRVLHHNGGPNQYKPLCPLFFEFVELGREIVPQASQGERVLRAHPRVRTSRVCRNPESDIWRARKGCAKAFPSSIHVPLFHRVHG